MRDTPWSYLRTHMWTQTILTWYMDMNNIKKKSSNIYTLVISKNIKSSSLIPKHYPKRRYQSNTNIVMEKHFYKKRPHKARVTYWNLWNLLGVPHDPHFFQLLWEMRCSLGAPIQILCATKFKSPLCLATWIPLFTLNNLKPSNFQTWIQIRCGRVHWNILSIVNENQSQL